MDLGISGRWAIVCASSQGLGRACAEALAAKRHGDPKEFGAMCAFICSAHAGFVSGMNVHLDGGSYRGIV